MEPGRQLVSLGKVSFGASEAVGVGASRLADWEHDHVSQLEDAEVHFLQSVSTHFSFGAVNAHHVVLLNLRERFHR